MILIPCYNCDDHIQYVIDNLSMNSIQRVSEIIIIDNGSTDNTVRKAVASAKKRNTDKIKVFVNNANYGLGGTHKVALEYARKKEYDYLVVLHGDGQANPKELDNFIHILDKNYDVDAILGGRFMDLSLIRGYSRIRTFGNIALNWFATVLSFKRVHDFGAGLNIFNVRSVCSLPLGFFTDACDFNIYLLFGLLDNNMKIIHIPISWSESGQRSNVTTFGIGFDTLKVILYWRFYGSWRRLFRRGTQTVFKNRTYKELEIK